MAVCASSAMSSAGTRSTALSQHCLCGARVPKPLAQRTGVCPHCGLHGDRDIVSAAVATCVTLTDPDDREPPGCTTDLPTPCGRGWPPSKSGRAQSTGTSITRCWIGQDRRPPPGGLC